MPRARRTRRRRSRSVARRSGGRTVLTVVLVAFGAIVVVGSVAEIHAQSSGYRSSTNVGYAALATRVIDSSTLTGRQLGTLISGASSLASGFVGSTSINQSARSILQLGLDQAVSASAREAAQAIGLAPPEPTGGVADRLDAVMAERATATVEVRTAIDQLLGMSPIPVAGAPQSTTPPAPSLLISPDQASAAFGSAGRLFERSDATYRSLAAVARSQATPMRLPKSAWVAQPVQAAPLGPTELAGAPGALSASPALQPLHRLVITSVGLDPPAIATGGPGVVPGPPGNSCRNQVSTVPGSAPTVLPPTGTITAALSVTNCGTVDEAGMRVTQDLVLSDPPGTAPPPPVDGGARAEATMTLAAGASVAVTLPPARVRAGHRYTLTLTVVPQVSTGPPLAGAVQQFLIMVAP